MAAARAPGPGGGRTGRRSGPLAKRSAFRRERVRPARSRENVHCHFTRGVRPRGRTGSRSGSGSLGSLHRGTFASVNVLVNQSRDYIDSRDEKAKPLTWTAAAGETLVKIGLARTSAKELVSNNAQ